MFLRWPVIAAVCGLFLATLIPTYVQQPAYAQGGGPIDGPAQDNNSPTLDCEILTLNPLNWFGCSIVGALQEAVQGMNNAIDAMLTVKTEGPNALFDPGAGYRKAWENFRTIAIGLVIIAGLVMLASQAFGFDFFDAYTVKKIFPRLVVSVIFIALSWEVMKFLVELSNVTGNSVRALIYQPFQGLGGPFNDALRFGNWTAFVIILIQGAAWAALGLAALLSFLVTAALGVLIAFLILLVRQMIIALLVILAPIAFALYILPNTQKAFDFWKGTLISMLVVFPIISAMIALGRVFALIAYGNGAGGPQIIQQLSAFAAFFMPYFLIPFAFRLAGGAIATIAGIANDRGRGAFDRLSNFRKGQAAKNVSAMRAGNRFEGSIYAPGSRTLAKAFNRATVGAGRGGLKGGYMGFGERGRQAIDQARRTASDELTKSDKFQSISNDDDALYAATFADRRTALRGVRQRMDQYARSGLQEQVASGELTQAEADLRFQNGAADRARMANRAVEAVNASIGYGRTQAIAAAQQLVNTGTGYNDLGDMVQTLTRASGGNRSTASSLAGYANSATKAKGRHDLAPSFGALDGLVQHSITTGNAPSENQILDASLLAARGVDNVSLLRDKTRSVQNHSRALSRGLQREQNIMFSTDPTVTDAQKSAARERAAQIAAKLENIGDSGAYGAEINVEAYHRQGMEPSRVNIRETRHTATPTVETFTVVPGDPTHIPQRVNAPNTDYDPNAGDAYSRNRQRTRYDPNDPNMQQP